MKFTSRGLGLGVLLAATAFAPAALQAATPKAPKCPAVPINLAQGVEVISVMRTYKGADGESHIETIKLQGTTKTYYNGSTTLTQYDLGDPTRVMLVYGHPNLKIEKHPSPYREIFLLLSGSSTIVMPDGHEIERHAGDMLIVEDQGTPGRSGRAGPCGYVALDLQFKPAEAK